MSETLSETTIHPTAIIADSAEIGEGSRIGPYCVIGDNVTLGPGSHLMHHVSIEGSSTFGEGNIFHPFTSIGGRSQDLKYEHEPTYLRVGDFNVFREYVTCNRGTAPEASTTIGSHNHFLAYAHVAHDCTVGSHCVFSNNGTLAGHVTVEDYAIIGGLSAIHQYCRIGTHAMLGGCTKIVQDVPPYFIADGNPAQCRTINQIGLQRREFPDTTIQALKQALRTLYHCGLNTSQAVEKIDTDFPDIPEIRNLTTFIRDTKRGIVR